MDGREVHLIAAVSWKTLSQELRDAGAQGYRLAPRGVLRHPYLSAWGDDLLGREAVLLLERSPDTTARYEYQIDPVELEYEWHKKTRRHRAKNYKKLDEQLLEDLEQEISVFAWKQGFSTGSSISSLRFNQLAPQANGRGVIGSSAQNSLQLTVCFLVSA